MKPNTVLLVGCAVLWIFGATGCDLIGPKWGPEHISSLESAPPFLTEEMAVAKAREALTIEGCKTNEWQPTRAQSPGKAPDGRPDEYINRFSRVDFGRVTFVKGQEHRTYDVRLNSNCVICSQFHGL
jgi:hypothetical protein